MHDKVRDVIYYLVNKLGFIESRTKLVKLLYLADVEAKNKTGNTITGLTYVYHFYGPYSPQIIETALEMDGEEIKEIYNPYFERYEYVKGEQDREIKLTEEEIKVLEEIIEEYGKLGTNDIKERAYQTEPMKTAKPGEVIKIYLTAT